MQHWKDVEEQLKSDPDMKGYKRGWLQGTTFRGEPAAVWEFTWNGRARDFRAIDLGFGREGGNEYAIYVSGAQGRLGPPPQCLRRRPRRLPALRPLNPCQAETPIPGSAQGRP
ncbi:hypothetical protein GCM10020000_32350 [Streptomyces olivoverticillatus]